MGTEPVVPSSEGRADRGWLIGRFLASTAHRPALTGVPMIGAMILAAWAVAYLAGGSRTVAPHLFYIPVIFASVRFGPVGAVLTGLASGLAAGPLLPLNVEMGFAQEPFNWMLRAGAFVLIGLLCAFLVRYSRTMLLNEFAKVVMRRDLQRALEDRHLHVVYQPIIELGSGRIVGAEALVRWSDPERGPRYPDQFIPVAEAAGVAHLISDYVLDEAFAQLSEWRAMGLIDDEAGFTMAVNISGTELHDDRLENKLREVVRRTDIPAGWMHLEITETALIDHLELAMRAVQRLRGVGVGIAIDDFGTGESSFRYLHKFPVEILKIDRSFVTPLVDDERGRTIVAGLASLACDLKMATVAEGVETAEHAQILTELGCDLAQGYYFAKPLRPVEFERRLRVRSHPVRPA